MTTGWSDACTKCPPRVPGVSGVAGVRAGTSPPEGVLIAPGKSGGPTKTRVLSPALMSLPFPAFAPLGPAFGASMADGDLQPDPGSLPGPVAWSQEYRR
ncbi:hypothetical protein T484DRAFT_1963742 [Baffinella frigidus]|nr:hypothetical protein T484DRAFT_1963742 [Cryptophyta sp. CCMP2293]